MLDLKLGVVYSDGRKVKIQVRPIDSVKFEEKYDIALTEAFQKDAQPKVTYLYFLAWSATDTTLGFEEWLRSIDEIEVGDDAGDAVPFGQAGPTGS